MASLVPIHAGTEALVAEPLASVVTSERAVTITLQLRALSTALVTLRPA